MLNLRLKLKPKNIKTIDNGFILKPNRTLQIVVYIIFGAFSGVPLIGGLLGIPYTIYIHIMSFFEIGVPYSGNFLREFLFCVGLFLFGLLMFIPSLLYNTQYMKLIKKGKNFRVEYGNIFKVKSAKNLGCYNKSEVIKSSVSLESGRSKYTSAIMHFKNDTISLELLQVNGWGSWAEDQMRNRINYVENLFENINA